jgi:hypothetical protein
VFSDPVTEDDRVDDVSDEESGEEAFADVEIWFLAAVAATLAASFDADGHSK